MSLSRARTGIWPVLAPPRSSAAAAMRADYLWPCRARQLPPRRVSPPSSTPSPPAPRPAAHAAKSPQLPASATKRTFLRSSLSGRAAGTQHAARARRSFPHPPGLPGVQRAKRVHRTPHGRRWNKGITSPRLQSIAFRLTAGFSFPRCWSTHCRPPGAMALLSPSLPSFPILPRIDLARACDVMARTLPHVGCNVRDH